MATFIEILSNTHQAHYNIKTTPTGQKKCFSMWAILTMHDPSVE